MDKQRNSIFNSIFHSEQFALVVALIAVIVIGAVSSKTFLTPLNIMNICRQVSLTAIAGVGMVMIITIGDIDLSVGSLQAAVGITVATVINATGSIFLTFLAAIAMGALIGAFNGTLVTKLGLNALIATLASMAIVRGLGMVVTQSVSIPIKSASFSAIGAGNLAGIPIPVIIAIVILVGFYFILNHSVFGRHIYAVGGNREAARLAGLPVKRIEFLVYVIGNILFAVSAFILTSRLGLGQAIAGTGFEMTIVAAVVLGGVSLTGGTGTLIGALIGMFILQLIQNILVLNNVSTFYHEVVRGIVIIIAVYMDVRRKQSAEKVIASKTIK